MGSLAAVLGPDVHKKGKSVPAFGAKAQRFAREKKSQAAFSEPQKALAANPKVTHVTRPPVLPVTRVRERWYAGDLSHVSLQGSQPPDCQSCDWTRSP